MNFSDFVKTLFSKTKRDLAYISAAAILLAGAIIAERAFSPVLWVCALLYSIPLVVLLAQQAEHAINSKKDQLNRHWVLFAIGLIMFGSTFIRNSAPHFRDAAITLFIYSFVFIITEAFTTAMHKPHHGKHNLHHDDTERNGETKETSPNGQNVGDIIKAAKYSDWPSSLKLAKKISNYLIILALPAAVATAILVPIIMSSLVITQWFITAFPRWLYRALMFATIACCDTIAFCHPLAVTGSFTKMLRNGIVINKYKVFDRLTKLRSLLFDMETLRKNTLTSNDVKTLKKIGVKHIVMASSEDEGTTSETARQLGITEYRSNMQPEDKAKLAKHLYRYRKKNTYLGIVGDNIEMRASQQAILSIAMTQPNKTNTTENANLTILGNEFSKICTAIKASKKMARISWCNLSISIVSKAILLALAFLGLAPIWLLALADICTLAITSLNAMRALK